MAAPIAVPIRVMLFVIVTSFLHVNAIPRLGMAEGAISIPLDRTDVTG
jgi:hypothetical protein